MPHSPTSQRPAGPADRRQHPPEHLAAPDTYAPQQFGTVINRLLYGLRHGQHHVGKLTGYLFSNGIDYDPWR